MPCKIKKTTTGQFMFNLKAANHEIILTSETYNQKASALAGIGSVRKLGTNDANFELRKSSSNQSYFVLKAANHQIIGNSEMYSSESAAKNGIDSVKRNSPSTEVIDLT